MDGYLSASMFYVYIKNINKNINVQPIFHNKNKKSHGLTDNDVFNKINVKEPSLLIIPDAGSNDEDKCKILRDKGWEIIIADHHFSEHWNKECILVNNHMSDKVQNKGLCGTGVTWKCLKKYDEMYGYDYARDLISYVAFANPSDSMDMSYQENRTFSKWGLQNIHKNLKPLTDEFIKGEVNNISLTWNATPKVNALIRLGELQDKKDLFYSLCGEHDWNDMIDRLRSFHSKQGTEVTRLLDKITPIYDKTCFLGKVDEKSPLLGLVANNISGSLLKPTILVNENKDGICNGSCRSVVPIKDKLLSSGLFIHCNGHKDFAFGVSYLKENENDIITYLDVFVELLEPCMDVLLSSTVKSIPNSLFDLTDRYSSLWGKGIDKPIFHIKPFEIYNTDITLGKKGVVPKKGTPIKWKKDGVEFIIFMSKGGKDKKARLFMDIEEKIVLSIECLVTLSVNEYYGRKTLQCVVNEFECNKIERAKKKLTFEEIF